MRKSLVLFLATVGGGGSYGASITEVARDAAVMESSTWRWHVNSILTDQQRAASRCHGLGSARPRGPFEVTGRLARIRRIANHDVAASRAEGFLETRSAT
jgi:hypothetical protein